MQTGCPYFMKTPMKIFFPYLLIGIFLCACQSTDTSGKSDKEPDKKDSLTLQVALMPTTDCLPFYYAERCGIFKELGVDVRLQTFRAQMDCDTAFAHGHTDVSYTDLIRAAQLQSKGTGLYAIMQTDGYHELITAKSKRIRDIKNLKEKMIAMARHSVTDMLLDTVIHDGKLDPTTVYHPQINDIVLRHDMLRNATIDAAFLQEPYITQCLLLGNRTIYDSRKNNIRMMAFSASYKAVKDKRKARQIELLVKGYDKAVDQINKGMNKDSIRRILFEYPVLAATADSLKLPVYRHAEKVDTANVNVALRFLKSRSLTGPKYTGDTLINTQFIR